MSDELATKKDLTILKQEIDNRIDALELKVDRRFDSLVDQIGETFAELRDHFDATIEHIEHDQIAPIHDKIALTDEIVVQNRQRIENLEAKTGLTNPFPT